MLKRIICTLLLLFAITSKGQEYKILYGKSILLDESRINGLKNADVKERVKRSVDLAKNLEYELTICGENAEFKSVDKLTVSNEEKFLAAQEGQKRIYDRSLNEVFTYNVFLGKTIIVKDSVINNKWEITKDTMRIQNFICYKAILSKEKHNPTLEVWFCPEFPYPFGPSYFYGLPGLVFKTVNKTSGVSFYIKSIAKYDCQNKKVAFPKEFIFQKDYELEIRKILKKQYGADDEELDKMMKIAKESRAKNTPK